MKNMASRKQDPNAAQLPPLTSTVPEGWPLDAQGNPKDYEDMTQEEMTFCIENFGALDVQSVKANTAGNRRMEEFSKGQTITTTPWHSRDEHKYDLAMNAVGMLSNTYLYVEQTQPETSKIKAPNPQVVPTARDLYEWIVENVWDGQKRTYAWVIRHGNRQVAAGNIPMGSDLGQQERFRKRIAALRENPAPTPPAPPAPPQTPSPFQGAVPIYAQPNLAREREREPPQGYLSQQEVEARIKAVQLEERQRFQAEMAAAEERRRAEEERKRLLDTVSSLSRELQEIKSGRVAGPAPAPNTADPKMLVLEEQLAAMQRQLQTSLQAPPASPPITIQRPVPPEPPEGTPEPPEGYYLAWDFARKRYYYAPKAPPPGVVGNTPAPVTPPAPVAPPEPQGIMGVVQQVVNTAKQTQEAGRLLVSAIPGLRLDDELGPPPKTGTLAAAPTEEEKPKEPEKPKVFHEEGGLVLRLDKEGNVQDFSALDLFANLGKFAEQGGALMDMLGKRNESNLKEERERAELEAHKAKLKAEVEAEQAKVEKLKAEAEQAKAQAIKVQQEALHALGVGDDQEEGVSSGG